MNSKERVLRAIEFRRPDRCPVVHAWLQGSYEHYGERLRRLYERHPADVVDVGFHTRMWGSLGQTGEFVDEWGILWRKPDPRYFGQPVRGPLEDLEKLGEYRPPDPNAPGRFDHEKIRRVMEENPHRFIRAYAGNLFELLQWLRGPANLWMDLYDQEREDTVVELIERVADYVLTTIDIWSAYPIDGILFMDDWGTNSQMFIHPDKWRRFFKPAYARIINSIHELGKPAEMHSDGHILEIIPDLIDLGLDVLNPQHNVMGNQKVRELCFGRICIRSDIDCQKVLPHGTREEVRNHVREVIEAFRHPDGGLILHGEVELDVPFENYEAMYRAFDEYGGYRSARR